jgi:hypothetical protein
VDWKVGNWKLEVMEKSDEGIEHHVNPETLRAFERRLKRR